MKNLFDKKSVDEIIQRIDKLQPNSPREWGKMNPAQMMAHCSASLEVATGEKEIPRVFIGKLIGRFFRSAFSNDKPFSKNSPTAEYFTITDSRDFEKEKQNLKMWIQKFYEGGKEKCTTNPHAFFGKLTCEEWSIGMYKHLDHHLRQFGV